jgi:hypothetical protein
MKLSEIKRRTEKRNNLNPTVKKFEALARISGSGSVSGAGCSVYVARYVGDRATFYH